jgi:hypothetical protein
MFSVVTFSQLQGGQMRIEVNEAQMLAQKDLPSCQGD